MPRYDAVGAIEQYRIDEPKFGDAGSDLLDLPRSVIAGFLGLGSSFRGSLYLIASDFTEPPSRKKEDFEVGIANQKNAPNFPIIFARIPTSANRFPTYFST